MVPSDHTPPDSHVCHQAVVLDIDRTGSAWLLHLLTGDDGILLARAPFASHHPLQFPPSIDRLCSVEAEFAPKGRGGYRSLSRLQMVKSRSAIGSRIEAAAAAALLSELMLRSRVTGQEAPFLLASVSALLDELEKTPCSASQAACYVLHQGLARLSLLSGEPSCPRCPPGLLSPPARFHVSSGEVTCLHHSASAEGPVEWGSDKLALHLTLLQSPTLQGFLDATAPLWDHFGVGLGWSFLQDLVGLTEHVVGPLKSWSFLRQLRPVGKSSPR